MKRRFAISLFLSMLAAVSTGFAQSDPPTAPTTASLSNQQDEPKSTPTDFFGGAIAGHWVFSAEFGYSQEYDDNVFVSPLVRLSDNVSRFNARFTASVQKKRLRMQVHYYPDYVDYSKYSDRNALSHQYAHEVGYRWSPHTDLNWNLTASRAPSYTNSPFTLVDFGGGVFLPVFRPEALQSDATITSASTSVTWDHQFTARQSLNVNLQGAAIRFQADNGVPLAAFIGQKSFSSAAVIRWDDEFIPKKRLGLEFSEQYFGFLTPASHTHFQYVKVRYTQQFGKGYQFSAGAGPSRHERQANSTLAGTNLNSIDYALDVSMSKTSLRQNIGITYNHGSQLGLTQGSIGSDSVSVSYARQLGKKWSWNSGFGYSRTESQTTLLFATSNSYSVNSNIQYDLLPNLTANAGYSYVFQDLAQNIPGSFNFDRNVYRIGLNYKFQRIASR